PAFTASSLELHRALQATSRVAGNSRTGALRRGLVVGQVALALMLLFAAGLLLRSFFTLQHVPLGYTPDGVLTARLILPEARYGDAAKRAALWQQLVARMQAMPGVEAAGITTLLPLRGNSDWSFD